MRDLLKKLPTTPTTPYKILSISAVSVVGTHSSNLLRNLLQPTTKLLATLYLSLKYCVSNNKLNVECSR